MICILPLSATLIDTINGHHYCYHYNPDPSRYVYESGSINIGKLALLISIQKYIAS